MRLLLIVLLLLLSAKGTESDAVIKNLNQVTLHIEIEIPWQDKDDADVQGLTENFFFDLRKTFPVNQPGFNACVVATFLANRTEYGPSFCKLRGLQNQERFDDFTACFKNRMSGDPTMKERNSTLEDEDHWHGCKIVGVPTVTVLIEKMIARKTWEEQARKLATEVGDTRDLFVVVSSFGNTKDPLRVDLYGLDKTAPVWRFNQANAGFGSASPRLVNQLWDATKELLKLCDYTTKEVGCYYSPFLKPDKNKECSMASSRHGTTKVPAHQKYCVYGYEFKTWPECKVEKCEESCRQLESRGLCDCEAGGRRRVYFAVPNTAEEQMHIWQCDGYDNEKYEDCSGECCELCPGGTAMLVIGLLILVVVGSCVFVGYWFLWRKRKPHPSTGGSSGAPKRLQAAGAAVPTSSQISRKSIPPKSQKSATAPKV